MTDQQPLTDQQLDDIDARRAALNNRGLPGGTWTASPRDEKSVVPPEMAHVVEDVLGTQHSLLRSSVGVFGDEAHAAFVARAPEDVDVLVAEVRRLRAERDELIRQRDQIAMDTLKAIAADGEPEPSGTKPCGHDDYHDPHEWAARPGVWCPGISYAEEPPAAEACGKCRRPFDPADTRFDGRAQHKLTPYCRRCVDLCHDNEIADHRCVICA